MKAGLLIATLFVRLPDFYYQLCCHPELFGIDMIPVMQLSMGIYRGTHDTDYTDYLPEAINDTE